jgi:hypothetical protein
MNTNYININKANSHLSPQTIGHKTTKSYADGNPCPVLGQAQTAAASLDN